MRVSAVAGAVLVVAGCGKKPAGEVIDAPQIDAEVAAVIDAAEVPDAKPLTDAVVATCTPVHGTRITAKPFAQAVAEAVWVAAPVGDRRVFIVAKAGQIYIAGDDGKVLQPPFLDISLDAGGPVNDGDTEQGLLGLAFHPDYAHNGRFYVQYTRADNAGVTAEYTVSADPGRADPSTGREVLVVPHPTWKNHNSGTIQFGPDGYLYVSTGDGGGSNDNDFSAKDVTKPSGKMLRIDVDARTGAKGYGIPPTNPYAASADGPGDPRPEIWSLGWRNPYRWDFDDNGDMIVADVGQGAVEEVDVIPAGTAPPENFGWNTWEGDSCLTPPCATPGFHMPQVVHTHTDGWCAIIGGSVYRGSCFPDLVGTYFYTDYCKDELWTFTPAGGQATGDRAIAVTGFPRQPTSISTDALGELYVTSGANGVVFHLVAEP